MNTKHAPAKLLCALGFVLLAGAATAQQYPGGGTPRGGLLGRPSTGGTAARPQGSPVDEVEFRVYQLHNDLKLTPAQEIAWGAFADKVKAMVTDIQREHERAFANATLNSLRQIDQTTDAMRNRLTALEDIAAVARLLYDRLTPEQKTIADPRLATIVQTAIRVETQTTEIAPPDLGSDPVPPPPPKPPKIRFGPPPAPDPSRNESEVGH